MLRLKHGREASVSRAKFEHAGAFLSLLALLAACGVSNAHPTDSERVVILPREADELDPRYVGDAYGLKLSRLLYASLVTIDPFTLAPALDLAERIEHDDPLRYRVHVRPGLRFADGSVLDASDVVATFTAIGSPEVKSRYRSSYARIKRVWAEDRFTAVFELSEPHATFVTDLELPVLRSEDAFSARRADALPVASGPYVLRSRTHAAIVLAPNPQHHSARGHSAAGRPGLRFVVVRDDNVRALRMLAGAGDLAQGVLPALLLPLFEGRADLKLMTAKGAGTTYLGIHLEHPLLRDVRIRQAIAYALDRPQLVRYKLGGRATLASSWLPEGHWAHAPDTPSYAFLPAKARDLLRAAGYAGQPLVLRTGSDRSVVSLARALAGMLAAIGMSVEVRPSETASLLSDLARGRFELTLMQVPEVFEPNVLSWFFASDRIPEPGVREGGNRFRLRSAELDRVLEDGRRESDLERRKNAYRTAQHLLARELPVIPLWHEDVVAVVSPRLFAYRVPRDARFATLAR